jgi:hypothetical protein
MYHEDMFRVRREWAQVIQQLFVVGMGGMPVDGTNSALGFVVFP